jgi:hypothetical protein
MDKGIEQTFLKRSSTNGQQIHEVVFSILSHKRNTNQNDIEIPSHPLRITVIKKTNNNKFW